MGRGGSNCALLAMIQLAFRNIRFFLVKKMQSVIRLSDMWKMPFSNGKHSRFKGKAMDSVIGSAIHSSCLSGAFREGGSSARAVFFACRQLPKRLQPSASC